MKLLLDAAGKLAPNLPEQQRAEIELARRKLLETSRSFSNALKKYFKTPEWVLRITWVIPCLIPILFQSHSSVAGSHSFGLQNWWNYPGLGTLICDSSVNYSKWQHVVFPKWIMMWTWCKYVSKLFLCNKWFKGTHPFLALHCIHITASRETNSSLFYSALRGGPFLFSYYSILSLGHLHNDIHFHFSHYGNQCFIDVTVIISFSWLA